MVQVLVSFLRAIGRCKSLESIGGTSLDFGFLRFIGLDFGSLYEDELDFVSCAWEKSEIESHEFQGSSKVTSCNVESDSWTWLDS